MTNENFTKLLFAAFTLLLIVVCTFYVIENKKAKELKARIDGNQDKVNQVLREKIVNDSLLNIIRIERDSLKIEINAYENALDSIRNAPMHRAEELRTAEPSELLEYFRQRYGMHSDTTSAADSIRP